MCLVEVFEMIIEDIVKAIKSDIAAEKLRPNEKLPTERKLQELFDVGRGTIREALKILVGMGLVTIKKGRGGGAFLTKDASLIVSKNIVDLFKLTESNVLSFLEFRRIIEPRVVTNAALHRVDHNLGKLKEAIDLLGREIQTKELFLTSTRNFFLAIAESTQNEYIVSFYKGTIPLLDEISKILYEIPTCVELSMHFFSQIYEAINDNDPSKGEMMLDAYLVKMENSVKDANNFRVVPGLRKGKIKWGVILDLTGATLDWGKQYAMGMIDAVRYLNENGGINGKTLELIIRDDKYKVSAGKRAYKEFKDDEKVIGIYIQSTGTNLSIAPMATKDRIFMFSGGTTARLSNPRKYPYYFSLGPTYSDMARAGIKYIRETWTIKDRNPKLVFMFPDNIYGRDLLNAAKMYAEEKKVDIGPDQVVNWPTLDTIPQLFSIQEFDPDYILITSTAMNAATILRDSKKVGIKAKFICNNRTFTEDLAKLAMGTAEGVFGIQPVAPYGVNVPGMEKIIKCHNKWHPYHDPSVAYVEGWANILIPMEASKIADRAGDLTADGLKEVMETFRDFDTGGIVPPLSYFKNDHRATTQSKIWQIENGRLDPITDYIDVERDDTYFEV
jgi:branched-chain amino acid transport system substrate-binding protein